MTCIVGLVDNKNVWMGCDSAFGDGTWQIRAGALPKIFKVGDFLIGSTGTVRTQQVLQFNLVVPDKQSGSDIRYMVSVFAEVARECLKEHGVVEIKDSQETADNAFLIAYKQSLYKMDCLYAITKYTNEYIAVGSGSEYAHGSLFSSRGLKPKVRIRKALEAATYFTGNVKPPFYIGL